MKSMFSIAFWGLIIFLSTQITYQKILPADAEKIPATSIKNANNSLFFNPLTNFSCKKDSTNPLKLQGLKSPHLSSNNRLRKST